MLSVWNWLNLEQQSRLQIIGKSYISVYFVVKDEFQFTASSFQKALHICHLVRPIFLHCPYLFVHLLKYFTLKHPGESYIRFAWCKVQWAHCIAIFFPVVLQSLKDLGRLTYKRFLELVRYTVGLLGRVISPSQGLYLHRTTQHRKTRTNIHALSGIRTHNPSNQPAKTHASDRTATVTGNLLLHSSIRYLKLSAARS
jgi:hypothetical protein